MNSHPARHSGQTGDSSPRPEHMLDGTTGDCALAPAKSCSALSAKLRRHGVKVVSALKSLTNSCRCF